MPTFHLFASIITIFLLPHYTAANTCSASQPCASNACCSQYGYCGWGGPWCGPGCQSGACYAPPGPTPPPTTPPPTISPKPTPAPTTRAPFPVGSCLADRNTVNFGYYESWAIYRNGACNPLQPNAINVAAFGYTHLAFSFAGISYNGLLEPYNGSTEFFDMYRQFNSLKSSNSNLKTLIAVGGWTFDQSKFTNAASTPNKRAAFARSVVTFCKTHGFDGIDFDWEYPVTRPLGSSVDYTNYPLLLKAVRDEFNAAGKTDWVISVATSINTYRIAEGYDMREMELHIDFFNIMSYDIHGSWDSSAGSNSDLQYIQNTMQYVVDILGVRREKIVLGLAAYGRSTRLSDPTCTTLGCPISGAGLSGCHGEGGNLPWFQIKEQYVDTGNFDSLTVNYATASVEMISGGNQYFTSFDNDETLNLKYQYAYKECFRGVMWWAVDLIKDRIVLYATPAPTQAPTTPLPTVSPKPSLSPTKSSMPSINPPPTKNPTSLPTLPPTVAPLCGVCPSGATGNFATANCGGFNMCVSGSRVNSFGCSVGTLFDEGLGVCNWASSVACTCIIESTPPPTPPPTSYPTKVGETAPPTPPPTAPLPTPPPSPPPTRPASCGECSTGTQFVTSDGCTGFHYCQSGSVGSEFVACPAGTLFSQTLQVCDWDYNVICGCSSGAGPVPGPLSAPPPTQYPTPPPAVVVGGVIGSPTTNPWYPDWQYSSTCSNDGRQPNWMTATYKFATLSDCCDAWFWWQSTCKT